MTGSSRTGYVTPDVLNPIGVQIRFRCVPIPDVVNSSRVSAGQHAGRHHLRGKVADLAIGPPAGVAQQIPGLAVRAAGVIAA
jgi:hypothetical protein